MTVGLHAVAVADPTRIALVDGTTGHTTTYAGLDEAANRHAQAFAGVGVRPGDRVAVMLHNGPDLFAAWNGAGRLGALIVPIGYRATATEAAYIIDDSGAVAFVHAGDDSGVGAAERAVHLRGAWPANAPALHDAPRDPPRTDYLGAPVVAMNYTSGTTGLPKGIARAAPRPAVDYTANAFMDFWGFQASDVHLLCGPAYHTAPGAYAQMHLMEGARVVFMDRWDADVCLGLIESERVTNSHMVPANFVRVLEVDWRRYDLGSIRKILHAAAPCPVAVKRRIIEVFPPGTVWEYFGMSEGMGTVISPDEWLAHPGSVGRAFPGVDVKILAESGSPCPPGEVGLIYVSSVPGHARFRYHGADEKTEAAWRGDYFTVGDLGWLDGDGYLFIADRRVDLVISGGVNIYPAEIENALSDHPDVVDAAVFGLPDERMGQRVHAVVEIRPGAAPDADALIDSLRGRLADFKLPRSVEFVDRLPREPTGKIRKRELREQRLRP
jgi:long-chain acyl-CoA synthetase